MENLKTKLKLYINKNLSENEIILYDCFSVDSFATPEKTFNSKVRFCNNVNVKEYIDSHSDFNDFQTMLFELIDNKSLKDSDVYNKVHIDRRLFSKIRSDKNYHPSKETVILLGIALELSENELDKLLDSASYSLPKNNTYDLILRFCFINKIFKISDINELLNEYQCKLFSY